MEIRYLPRNGQTSSLSINVSLIRILTIKETTVVHLNSELVLIIAYIEPNDSYYYLIYLGYTRNPKP